MAILFLFTISCSLTSVVLAALSADVGGSFSIVYEPQSTDLWNLQGKYFIKQNVDNLLKQISGDSTVSVADMSKINELAASRTNCLQMIENSKKIVSSQSNEVSANSVNAQIIVELGGLKWMPVYLSTTNEGKEDKHDVILTLWLNDSEQLGWNKYGDDEILYYNAVTWSSGWLSYDQNVSYPADMYGTSYIRAVVLNNGGAYATSKEKVVTYNQNPDSVFALFTMSDGGLTEFITTPEQVSWQESGQNAKKSRLGGVKYNIPNENWGNKEKVPDDGFWRGYTNYADKEGNDAWKNDYIWLPSITETGGTAGAEGIWETKYEQRGNCTHTWLRSGGMINAGYSWLLYPNDDFNSMEVTKKFAVRPALHLNLTKVAESLAGN